MSERYYSKVLCKDNTVLETGYGSMISKRFTRVIYDPHKYLR